MKKIEYQAPKTEIVELRYQTAMLAGSDGNGSTAPGTGGGSEDLGRRGGWADDED